MKLRETRTWKLLMTPVGRRVPIRNGKGAPHGVALLMVMLALALLSAVVTDLGDNEMVRYKLACNDRDAMKAQALAESGTNVARLLLAVQAAVQPLITQLATLGIPLPAHTVWQLIPMDSDILKGLTSGDLQQTLGLDVSKAVEERKAKIEEVRAAKQAAFDKTKEGAGKEAFVAPAGGFGGFDGSFHVDVVDEEQKAVSLRGWATTLTPAARFAYAQRLFLVFQPTRYDFLFEDRDAQGNRTDRFELTANLYDWIDDNQDATDGRADQASWGRQSSGPEDGVYTSYRNVRPKNAYFDSPAELRMVRGMSDAALRAFGDSISIYGEAKINILSATQQSIEALVFACAQPNDPLVQNLQWMSDTLSLWQEWKTLGPLGGGGAVTPDGFVAFLDKRGLVVVPTCKDNISTESRNFTVKSTATVGDVTRTTTAVMRVYGATEELYFYSVH